MKNKLLLILIWIIKFFLPTHPKKERILVIATTALGDTLWATPALENIRRTFPNAFIGVLTSPVGKEIFKHNPWINSLFLLEEPLLPRFFSLWRTLYRQQFDTVLLFHASQRLTLPLCSLIGASRIIGTAGINKGLDSLLTHSLPNLYQHEIVRRLKICEEIGVKTETETLSFYLEKKLSKKEGGPWIAIHPGSKDGFKRWPAQNFVAVGKKLREKLGCKILITGNPSEAKLMEEIASQIPGAQINDPKSSLHSFGTLLNQIDLLICNDTGPVHLACAVNTPVVALYCATDPVLCGPHQAKRAIAISKSPTCTPCLKKRCLSPFCLLQIGVEEVADAALKILSL